jgi:hypothetical protein
MALQEMRRSVEDARRRGGEEASNMKAIVNADEGDIVKK